MIRIFPLLLAIGTAFVFGLHFAVGNYGWSAIFGFACFSWCAEVFPPTPWEKKRPL